LTLISTRFHGATLEEADLVSTGLEAHSPGEDSKTFTTKAGRHEGIREENDEKGRKPFRLYEIQISVLLRVLRAFMVNLPSSLPNEIDGR